jgi:hypothetical protein
MDGNMHKESTAGVIVKFIFRIEIFVFIVVVNVVHTSRTITAAKREGWSPKREAKSSSEASWSMARSTSRPFKVFGEDIVGLTNALEFGGGIRVVWVLIRMGAESELRRVI